MFGKSQRYPFWLALTETLSGLGLLRSYVAAVDTINQDKSPAKVGYVMRNLDAVSGTSGSSDAARPGSSRPNHPGFTHMQSVLII